MARDDTAKKSAASSASGWLSRGFEALVAQPDSERCFDVIIVGSGYGGAIAAAELAGFTPENGGRPLSVCVLERGNEYLPGSFPAHWGELPKHLRFNGNGAKTGGVSEGLFDFRLGDDVNALMASGLGGGSLINAGVMIEADDKVFDERWPVGLRKNAAGNAAKNSLNYPLTRQKLGVKKHSSGEEAWTQDVGGKPLKMQHLNKLANNFANEASFEPATISVNIATNEQTGDRQAILQPCLQCGDCATGCNYGAKKSLDTNLLLEAAKNGAELYTGATVLRFARVASANHSDNGTDGNTGWEVLVTYTSNRLKERLGTPVKLRTKQLIIAAGTYGSTELLMRSQTDALPFSAALGSGFSSNGDMIAAGYPKEHSSDSTEVNAIASEREPPRSRKVGPTITGIVKLPTSNKNHPHIMVQEMAAPGPMSGIFSELVTTSRLLHSLGTQDKSQHENGRPKLDPAAVDPASIKKTSIYAAFGNDDAEGKLQLCADHNRFADEQGGLTVHWPALRNHKLFDTQIEALEKLAPEQTILPNPGWRMLPKSLEYLSSNVRGPLLTVHPLGGCRMADNVANGVVDEFGRVYQPQPDKADDGLPPCYPGLMVLDGAIVPSALEANPALTISALALRGISEARADFGYWHENITADESIKPLPNNPITHADNPQWFEQRPWFRDVEQMYADEEKILKERQNSGDTESFDSRITFAPPPSIGNFSERLSGEIAIDGHKDKVVLELTLQFEPIQLSELYTQGGRFCLQLADNHGKKSSPRGDSRLRLYDKQSWETLQSSHQQGSRLERQRDQLCLLSTELHGELRLFERAKTSHRGRVFFTTLRWLRMRGARDIVLGLMDRGRHYYQRSSPNPFMRGLSKVLTRFQLLVIRDVLLGLWSSARRKPKPLTEQGTNQTTRKAQSRLKQGLGENLRGIFALASRGGEIRLMNYELQVGELIVDSKTGQKTTATNEQQDLRTRLASHFIKNAKITAQKRINYRCFSSPMAQLTLLPLSEYPGKKTGLLHTGLFPNRTKGNVLALDYQFMVDKGQALFKLHKQHSQATAMGEIGQWGFYLFRLLLGIHIWSLRAPDKASDRTISRLPQPLQGMPSLQYKWFTVDHYLDKDGEYRSAMMRLSRYPNTQSLLPPVLCLHGYSASGTTFTHQSIKANLASTLAGLHGQPERDVWVLDMRGSPDVAGSDYEWSFEDLAYTDIPLAVDWICRETGHQKIDIVAHCMGAAMVSMAILSADENLPVPDCDYTDRLPTARKNLPNNIRKLVMSQVGPTVMPTPANRMKGYLARFILQHQPGIHYHFRPGTTRLLAEQMLDRLLAAQDYPRAEMRAESPLRPWKRLDHIGSRRRIDGLFGRTFELDQLDKNTLLHLDDLFGPTNLATIAQAGHFARWFSITQRDGRTHFISRKRLRDHWKDIPTLYLHGEKNAMMDVANRKRMRWLFDGAGLGDKLKCITYPNHGHQDLLIGKNSSAVFRDICHFLDEEESGATKSASADTPPPPAKIKVTMRAPWSGPKIGLEEQAVGDVEANDANTISIAFGPPPDDLAQPSYILFIAVKPSSTPAGFEWPTTTPLELDDDHIEIHPLHSDECKIEQDWLARRVNRKLFDRYGSVLLTLVYTDHALDKSIASYKRGSHACNPAGEITLSGLKAEPGLWQSISDALVEKLANAPTSFSRGLLQPKLRPLHSSSEDSQTQPLAESNSENNKVSFVFGSCQFPRGLLDEAPAMESWKALGKRLDDADAPSLLLLLGDQIYTDATAGVFDPVNADDRFSGPYQKLYRQREVSNVLRRLPSTNLLDDHEIIDNWEPDARDPLPGLFERLLETKRAKQAIADTPAYKQLQSYRPRKHPRDGRRSGSARDRKLNQLAHALIEHLAEENDADYCAKLITQFDNEALGKAIFWEPLLCGDDSSHPRLGLQAYIKYQRAGDWRITPNVDVITPPKVGAEPKYGVRAESGSKADQPKPAAVVKGDADV